ncbi:MAG: hypothetical protein WBP93_16875 [Pyrinomonadaceae bacterium]
MPKKIYGLLLFVIAALCCAANAYVMAQQGSAVESAPASTSALKPPVLVKHPREALYSRAKKAGGNLVWRYRPNRGVLYPTVEELAKRSDIIVVGRILGHRSSLRPDGKFITQDYLVRVQEVIRGDLPNSKSIIISLPGGDYRYPDGTHVHVMPIGYRQPEDGSSYVFFLRKKTGEDYKGYRLVSETQGLFGMKNDQVEPANLVKSDPVVVKYRGMATGEFLRQIHKAVPIKK